LIADRTALIVFQEGTSTMQAPQNFASAQKAQASSANCSNRAAVNELFQNTGALLGSYRSEFRTVTRARHKEAESYIKNLRRSVREMLAEMRQNREEATNSTREQLKGYVEELHETIAGAMHEVDEGLQEISRHRHEAAHELAQTLVEDHDALCEHERRQLEELADSRRKNTRALHSDLCAFKEDLAGAVAQERKHFRQELGLAEPARTKTKAKRARASQPKIREEEPQKKSAPEKTMPRKAKARPAAAATKASPANPMRQAGAKKTAKAMAGARMRKRRIH
jgi:hypothetical protein